MRPCVGNGIPVVHDKRFIIRLLLYPLLGAAAIAVGAWFSLSVPGTEVPQTGQFIAVLVCGALLAMRGGALAVAFYLLLGALGLPIYSDGGAGWGVLFGGKAGYFAGFVAGPWSVAPCQSAWGLVSCAPWRHPGRPWVILVLS